MDKIYKEELGKNEYKKLIRTFAVFVPLRVYIYGTWNENFLIRKGEFTKYLYIRSGCRVYFTDADVISMLLQIKNETVLHEIVAFLIMAYHGEFETYRILAGQKEYEVCGIPQVKSGQTLVNEQDIDIPFDEILILLNLIISKDYAAERLQQWENKPSFLKQTLAKYISLIKFYYDSDENARKYLTDMGYDTSRRIHENYADAQSRNEKNNFFCNFKVFEESGMI